MPFCHNEPFSKRHLIKRHIRERSEVLHFKRKWLFKREQKNKNNITLIAYMYIPEVYIFSQSYPWNGLIRNATNAYFFLLLSLFSEDLFIMKNMFGFCFFLSTLICVEFLGSKTIVQCFGLESIVCAKTIWNSAYCVHQYGKYCTSEIIKRAAWCKQPFFIRILFL